MNDKELVELKLPGVGHAIAAAPHMGWPAEGVAIWPGRGKVGIRAWYSHQAMSDAVFSCTTCGHAHQPWSEWVDLAKRIIAVDEAMKADLRP